jgi:mannose-1-phosphate guanylyltransferase
MHPVAVIMAGGAGERFWPLSRRQRPKQLLRLTPSARMLVEDTVDRLQDIVAPEDVYVMTSAALQPLLRRALPQVPPANIIAEPMRRNTAACLMLAAAVLSERFPNAGEVLMAVFPSDHSIEPLEEFHRTLRVALQWAASGPELVTIGIVPTRAETGYGYIELGEELSAQEPRVYRVRRFREKPSLEVAQEFLSSGRFLWNSGMFFWRLDTFQEAVQRYMPEFWRHWDALRAAVRAGAGHPVEGPYAGVEAVFAQLPELSIDYALAERAERMCCVRATFRWDDLGAWDALERLFPPDADGNIVQGNVVLLDCSGCIVLDARTRSSSLLTLLGMRDCVVVLTDDAQLICPKAQAQRVRELVSLLQQLGYEAVL